MKKTLMVVVAMLTSLTAAFANDYGKYYQNLPVKMEQPVLATSQTTA